MKIAYIERRFAEATLATISAANRIIAEYAAQGFTLTLRQLYYQFVARDLIANRTTEYKRLGSVVNDGRLAGLIDWNAIEDRTRNLQDLSHWAGPSSIVDACSSQFRVDKWEGQPNRVEVWIEKEALAGVFARVCQELDVPYFSCRGYVSQSELHVGALRLKAQAGDGQKTIILHFGDHDPSGIDMTRDIADRMRLFGCDVEVRRLALNMPQVEQYGPPPNPAKETDSRFNGYRAAFGESSWELDALEPAVLAGLVSSQVTDLLADREWKSASRREDDGRRLLSRIANNWGEVESHLDAFDPDEGGEE